MSESGRVSKSIRDENARLRRWRRLPGTTNRNLIDPSFIRLTFSRFNAKDREEKYWRPTLKLTPGWEAEWRASKPPRCKQGRSCVLISVLLEGSIAAKVIYETLRSGGCTFVKPF